MDYQNLRRVPIKFYVKGMLSFFFIKFDKKRKVKKKSKKSENYLIQYYEKNKARVMVPNTEKFEINITNLAKIFSKHGKSQKRVLTLLKIVYILQSMYRKKDVNKRLKRIIRQLTLGFSLYHPPVRKHLRKSPTRTVFRKIALTLRKRFYLGTRFLLQAVVNWRKKLKCNLSVAILFELHSVLYRTRRSATYKSLRKFIRETTRMKGYDHIYYIRTRRRKEKERKNRLGKKSRWLRR